jgi:hypothetical protein
MSIYSKNVERKHLKRDQKKKKLTIPMINKSLKQEFKKR